MNNNTMNSQISLAKLLINYLARSLRTGYKFYRKSDNFELCTVKGILETLLAEQDVMTIPPKPGMEI
jgi:hypothetical protein